MLRRAIEAFAILILAIVVWFVNLTYPSPYLVNAFYTLIIWAILHIIFKLLFEEAGSRGVKDQKARYLFRKAISIVYVLVLVVALIRIWVEHSEAILVTYGLIGAGIAISLQDFFKNFVGGMLIFSGGLFKVGDRIEITDRVGDVIDVGIMYTTLLELKEWVDGDQATGRLAIIPNGAILSNVVINYTKDHEFIWDEITIKVSFDSDWKKAVRIIEDIANKETTVLMKKATKEIAKISQKYYLTKRAVEPIVFTTLSDSYIVLNLRYVTNARNRRALKSDIYKKTLEEIEKTGKINLASAVQVLDGKLLVATKNAL